MKSKALSHRCFLLPIIASGHRDIIAKRSQRIADRKKASKEFLASCEAEIARVRTVMVEHKAKTAEDNASDKQIIGMSRAALATVE